MRHLTKGDILNVVGIFNFLLIFFWIIFLAVWFVASLFAKKNRSGSYPAILFRSLVSLGILLWFAFGGGKYISIQSTSNTVLGTLGVICAGAGIAFAIWARVHIGRNWGMPMSVKEKPELVTSGPYAYVRHPIYTGILLAVFGSVLVSSFIWIIPLIAIAAYFYYSAKTEERNMRKEFPEKYPVYMKRTKMLIPFVF